jgi:mevalonate kinase
MVNQTTLNKGYTIKDGGVTIVETIEKQLSKEDLQTEKVQYINRQLQLSRQMQDLQKLYDDISVSINEIDEMIEKINQQKTTIS